MLADIFNLILMRAGKHFRNRLYARRPDMRDNARTNLQKGLDIFDGSDGSIQILHNKREKLTQNKPSIRPTSKFSWFIRANRRTVPRLTDQGSHAQIISRVDLRFLISLGKQRIQLLFILNSRDKRPAPFRFGQALSSFFRRI